MEEKLVILLDKASNPNNTDLDVARIDAFCCAVKNEPALAVPATKLLADRIQSQNPFESLNALSVLDECMSRCGPSFQNAVGRFRFLNELVKIVSPKYLANQTSVQVKTKILDLLLLWTVQYPNETKVKEAYQMLRRQGVDHQSPNPISIQKKSSASSAPVTSTPTPHQDTDPTSLKIKQLIQSKKPDRVDIHAANLLIQNFYEIEKKKTLRVQEIRKGRENVSVLEEMLDHFSVAESSADDLALIKELSETCKSLQPTIRLLTESEDQQHDEQVMQEALETNDALVQVLQKYEALVVNGGEAEVVENRELTEPLDDVLIDMRGGDSDRQQVVEEEAVSSGNDALADIFGSISTREEDQQLTTKKLNVLQPLNSKPEEVKGEVEQQSKEKISVDIDSMISEIIKATKSQSEAAPKIIHNFEGVSINLDSVETRSDLPPHVVLNEPQGLRVALNFTKEHPKDDLAVIVVTVANLSTNLISDISVELLPGCSDCEVKVLEDCGKRSLAGVKRFSSAFDDLALIVLVSNPKKVHVKMWNVRIGYNINGLERRQEMLTISDLPHLF